MIETVKVIEGIVTVLVVIDMILMIIMVLLQADKSGGLGGLFGGASKTAFGSGSMDIFAKITAVMAAIFIVGSFALAYMRSYIAKGERIEDDTVPALLDEDSELGPSTDENNPSTETQNNQSPPEEETQ